MNIFDVLTLLSGLALFLFGMEIMGDALKKSAGGRLKAILGKMTSNQFKGILLGLGVTAVIQSSSATTVMVVGFVNSGTMTLRQAIGVILGANVGTAVTSWLTALSALGDDGAAITGAVEWLKPDAWMPILALIGICLLLFGKRGKRRDVGLVLLGFAVLMTGMDVMSSAVSGLKESEAFRSILTMFENPILGVLAGLVLTAIVQSSSASVGILQALTATGGITFGAAIPIVMGQNIGTCVTAMISSVGANRNGKRAALVHLYFNVVSVAVVLSLFYLLHFFLDLAFVGKTIDAWGVAIVHTAFKILSVILFFPFTHLLEKLAVLTVPKKEDEEDNTSLLDDRLLDTPTVAVESAERVTRDMAKVSCDALHASLGLMKNYDAKTADAIRAWEGKADLYEDAIGSYLVKLSSYNAMERDSHEITKLLHLIGDFERISDHAVNILESVEEMRDKKIEFSAEAQRELAVMSEAIGEILRLTYEGFVNEDLDISARVEPLEQVVDDLRDRIKLNHVLRVQKNACTIEHGFILSDLLTNFERVSDHCSNIAGCLIEINRDDSLEVHKYLNRIKAGGEDYEQQYKEYSRKYAIGAS